MTPLTNIEIPTQRNMLFLLNHWLCIKQFLKTFFMSQPLAERKQAGNSMQKKSFFISNT